VRVEVHKRERTLHALCEGGGERRLRVALGREPEGPKRRADDQSTPEGDYRIAGPARRSRFHLFLPIDYPSQVDADAARAAGTLSASDHRRILEAHRRGVPPPGDTPLGGRIGFHGEGARWEGTSRHLDWTYGCVALSDADIDFLAARLQIGTPVTILPAAPR
jgi:murein L,D-transpeptidase YafK